MVRANEELVKEIKVKLGELKDELTKIVQYETNRFEALANSEWESYRVQEELSPCPCIEEAVWSIKMAIESLDEALEV